MWDAILGAIDAGLERIRNRTARDNATGFVLLLPALSLLAVFGIYPLFFALRLSLYDTRQAIFVGLGNYAQLFHDREFWSSLAVTVYYAIGAIPVAIAISLVIALSLFRLGRGRGFFRTVFFLPFVTSVVAAATVWRALLNPRFGVANAILAFAGFEPMQWLLEPRGVLHVVSGGVIPPSVGPSLALTCIILFEIWHASGFMIVILLAGLSAIPRELEEAAAIDGASRWQVTRRVILPMLSPTLFFLVIVSSIKAFQAFNSFYAMSGSTNRGLDTQNLVIFLYRQLYEYHRYGYGSAVATALCVAIVLLTAVQWRVASRRVHYQ